MGLLKKYIYIDIHTHTHNTLNKLTSWEMRQGREDAGIKEHGQREEYSEQLV